MRYEILPGTSACGKLPLADTPALEGALDVSGKFIASLEVGGVVLQALRDRPASMVTARVLEGNEVATRCAQSTKFQFPILP